MTTIDAKEAVAWVPRLWVRYPDAPHARWHLRFCDRLHRDEFDRLIGEERAPETRYAPVPTEGEICGACARLARERERDGLGDVVPPRPWVMVKRADGTIETLDGGWA